MVEIAYQSRALLGLIALAAFCGLAFSSPILQVTNYTTIPSTVYPGASGYVQLTLQNTGDETAESISLSYDASGVRQTVLTGDISAGSTSQVPVPFKVSESSGGTIQMENIIIYYYYPSSASSGTQGSSSSTLSKSASLSVPISVHQYNPISVRTLQGKGSMVSPGGAVGLALEIKNNGGVVNSLEISAPENSSFQLEGASKFIVGNLEMNSTAKVNLSLLASADAATGLYNVPLEFTYQDNSKTPNSDTINVGPISVVGAGSQYHLGIAPVDGAEIGSVSDFSLTLENAGTTAVSGTVSINSTDTLTPVGGQSVSFENVAPGASASKILKIGISPSKSAGYYVLPVTFYPNSGASMDYNLGIAVQATPDLTVTLEGSDVQIANTGNTQLRSVYVEVYRQGSSTLLAKSFIGTLSVDDFATVSVSSQLSSLDVKITFRDSTNEAHTITRELSQSASSFTASNSTTGASSGSGRNFSGQRNNNPLGMLFGGPGSGSTANSGSGWILVGAGAVVVAVAGFLIYKRFKGKPKNQALADLHQKISGHSKPK